ncbi:CRISPR-associated protein, Cmr5 family [Anaerovibrio sp. JC8]|uniref:type III-B CRISPR module-associated protein Cmr5 n=1 Tax=Anaerovibrio sp. JC8 TaxID=1240085 RepID=UPI000A0BC637|nr:type III-B CRISPR module-associated protein Cmr5 [Anaerovibrio sp. JC8]ORU00264.1 CRISPR-associated protein, Cmr5 family [Anaerovibrio sp. JC8]
MNKRVINDEIESAYSLLAQHGIAQDGKIDRAFRGQISSFGAAITMGSLLAAIAYFSKRAGASVERQLILAAIYDIVKSRHEGEQFHETLFEYAIERKKRGMSAERDCKEEILNAAIALKLAMNLYELVDKKAGESDEVQ